MQRPRPPRSLLAPSRVLAAVVALVAAPARAADVVIQPGGDFCGAFNSAAPGDQILLAPGDHMGPCTLSQGGEAGNPKALRAQDPGQPTAIVYNGNSSNVIDVTTSHVVIADLRLGPTNDAIDAIKIKSGDDVRIEGCHFFQIGGISVAANSTDSQGVAIVGNFFEDLHATGIYLGCHDGMGACSARDYVIEGNLIDGVDSAAVGYGLEVKLDSHGVVRDNVIHDTKGPGIEIYGSTDLARSNLVDGNLVIGSRNNGTLEIAGGPTVVRSNIVIGGVTAGLYVYDYGDRGLVRAIQVVGNTVIGDEGPAVVLSKWAADKELEFTSNAVWQESGGGPALPAMIPGVPMEGNLECADPSACWIDGPARDLWPVDGGPLLSGGAAPALATLDDDFCHQARSSPPQVGALERSGAVGPGPLPIDFKDKIPCPDGAGTTSGGETTGGSTTGGTSAGTTSGTTGATSGTTGATSGTDGTTGATDSTGATGATSGGASSAGEVDSATTSDEAMDGGGCACRSEGGSRGALGPVVLIFVALGRRRGQSHVA